MLRQIKLLTSVQLCNLFGINEIRHTKDKKKKQNALLMAVTWGILLLIFFGYLIAFSLGYAMLGMAELLPMMLYTVSSLIILFFSFFKAGSVIFSQTAAEPLFALPVSESAIVASRFLTMYVTDVIFGIAVLLPGSIVYCMYVTPGAAFFVSTVLGVFLLPILPLTIATILGAGITALTAKLKHKSIWSAFLSIAFIVVVLAGSMSIPEEMPELNEEAMAQLADLAAEQIGRTYPPAAWYAEAVCGEVGSLFLLFAVSVVPFGILLLVLKKYFMTICIALKSVSGHTRYAGGGLKVRSLTGALTARELRRYFASSVYVTNTMVGYVMMVIASVAVCIAGVEKVEAMFGVSGVLKEAYPLLLGVLVSMVPITSCSVSMEGKQWWLLQSLPLRRKDIYRSKILVNLLVAAPFLIVTLIVSAVALRPSAAEAAWLIAFPVVCLLLTSVTGLAINLAMPVMNWESEVRVVKQSASTFCAMLSSLAVVILPVAALFLLPLYCRSFALWLIAVAYLLLAFGVYIKISKKEGVL
ncbi:MAG: hypothetical protein ACI4FZ_01155 [Lachnospiraceae bacterium]